MDDRNLILGVLAAQAGFVTPAQVVAAGSARLLARDGRSVLDHLVESGALTPDRRNVVQALADAAIGAHEGDAQRVLRTLDGARGLTETLGALAEREPPVGAGPRGERVPLEPADKYQQLDELGRGGQSIVWRALDRFVGREVALKELRLPGNDDSPTAGAARARFLREARLTAQLDHPGIVAVHELAERPDGTLYAAQKLVRGRTLKVALAQCRTLEQRLELLPHLVDAAQAVAYAHARGVVHRDLKPSNVMVGSYGETVVVDWGLAKRRQEDEVAPVGPSTPSSPELTQAGQALGTPSYMSPEQARGDLKAIDERSDVFSLGAMLYELLTGRPPFEGVDNAQVVEAVRSGRFVPVRVRFADAPAELAAIAERALRPVPAERYPDAGAFARELVSYQTGGRVEAYRYGSLELVRKFVRANRSLSAAIAAAVLILLGGVVAVVVQLRHARANLASALIERALRAEDVGDWGRAAAYYAASRMEKETVAARWGLALATQRIPERGSALAGPRGSFTDVDVLPDGTVVALEVIGKLARLHEPVTGKTVWTAQTDEPIRTGKITDGAVRLHAGHLWRILDLRSGRELFTSDDRQEVLCRNGAPSRRGRIDLPWNLHVEGAEDVRIEVAIRDPCAISQAGGQMAFRDRQGMVRLWDLDARREVTTRPAPDARDMIFTGHGLALVRSGALQLLGGPDGDFSVEVPGLSASGFVAIAEAGRALAVSPDGHRVVVDIPNLGRAAVLDLRDRAVLVSVSRPPGDPSYAFAPDGGTLYAAGLGAGRALISWKLRRPEPTVHEEAESRFFLRVARDRFVLIQKAEAVELRTAEGTLVRAFRMSLSDAQVSWDGSTLAVSDSNGIVVQQADDGRELARIPTDRCAAIRLAGDGSRVACYTAVRRRVWNVRGPSLVRDEPLGNFRLGGTKSLSMDGRRMVWAEPDALVIQDVDTGTETRLSLPDTPAEGTLSPDGRRLAVSLAASFSVYQLPGLERVWSVPSAVGAGLEWSADSSVLLAAFEGAGALLLDARTGEALARIIEGRAGAGEAQVNVLPGLRSFVSRGARSWSLRPLPQPENLPPAESLRRALAAGGFRLRGLDLETLSP